MADRRVCLSCDIVIDAFGVEHRRGRRLYVGTANLDAQRDVIWDMGAIGSLPISAPRSRVTATSKCRSLLSRNDRVSLRASA